ncbi:MAG: hypothetical protein WA718_11945 [Terriglobales bacterium]
MKKTLFVTILLVLGCSAAFGQYTFGLLGYNGTQYCDYVTFATYDHIAGGTHILTSCGYAENAALVGTSASLPAALGFPVSGAVFALADNVIDVQDDANSGVQYEFVSKTKVYKPKKPVYGWMYVYSFSGCNYCFYLGNYGYLDAPPAKGQVKSKTASFSTAKANVAKGGNRLK